MLDPSFYFSETLAEAQSRFRGAVRASEKAMQTMYDTTHLKVSCAACDETDLFYMKRKNVKSKAKLIVISSGVHGIEGFAGSALQLKLLNQSTFFDNLSNCDLLFVHAVNPWGMKYKQRSDENNIDINRNCFIDPQHYFQKNHLIQKFESILAPHREAQKSNAAKRVHFHWELIRKILKNGIEASTLALSNGQFQWPEQLFYGGKELTPHLAALKAGIADLDLQYEEVAVLDIHTGLGQRNSLQLLLPSLAFMNSELVESTLSQFNYRYENRTQPVKPGIFCEWICDLIEKKPKAKPKNLTLPVVFEIGTHGFGDLFSELKSLQILVRANQLRFHGAKGKHVSQEISKEFEALFYPKDLKWRNFVLNSCARNLQLIMTRFNSRSVQQIEVEFPN